MQNNNLLYFNHVLYVHIAYSLYNIQRNYMTTVHVLCMHLCTCTYSTSHRKTFQYIDINVCRHMISMIQINVQLQCNYNGIWGQYKASYPRYNTFQYDLSPRKVINEFIYSLLTCKYKYECIYSQDISFIVLTDILNLCVQYVYMYIHFLEFFCFDEQALF